MKDMPGSCEEQEVEGPDETERVEWEKIEPETETVQEEEDHEETEEVEREKLFDVISSR